jgi:hypothetical protein
MSKNISLIQNSLSNFEKEVEVKFMVKLIKELKLNYKNISFTKTEDLNTFIKYLTDKKLV